MTAINEIRILDYSYNTLLTSEAYFKKAKNLNKEEADRLFSRMRGSPLGKLVNNNFNSLESLAIQLEIEDQHLSYK